MKAGERGIFRGRVLSQWGRTNKAAEKTKKKRGWRGDTHESAKNHRRDHTKKRPPPEGEDKKHQQTKI